MIPTPPPGQGPIDPRGAFVPPPPPGGVAGGPPPSSGPVGMPPMMPMAPMPPMGQWGPPRRRGGAWKWAIIVVLLLLLIGSVILNCVLAAGLAMGSAVNQTIISAGDSHQTIAVIPIEGMIDGATAQHFGEMFDRAEKDDDVKAVVIRIDTPGGEVGASDEMWHRIEQFKQIRKIPVVISMGTLATSGGYYVSSAGDYLFAEPTTDTADIGVLLPDYNVIGLMDKLGIADQTIVSTGTPFKDVGSPTTRPTPTGEAYLQRLVNGAFDRFKRVVVLGRGKKLTESIDDLANGKVYMAEEAKSAGLVDDIGYLSDATHYAAGAASLSNPQVVQYEEPTSLLKQLLLGESSRRPGQSPAAINVSIDPAAIDRLSSVRMMYLWRP